MHSEFLELLHKDRWTEINKGTKWRTFVAVFPELTQSHSECILLLIAAHTDNVPVMCNWTVLTVITQKLLLCIQLHKSTAHLLYKYCTNCTVCNWTVLNSNYTEAAAMLSAAQQHSTFTVQMLYKLYSVQLNCTYSNYTEAAATCSAAQQHSTFTVQILYKLYSVQLSCTYSNYTEAAATCSAA